MALNRYSFKLHCVISDSVPDYMVVASSQKLRDLKLKLHKKKCAICRSQVDFLFDGSMIPGATGDSFDKAKNLPGAKISKISQKNRV